MAKGTYRKEGAYPKEAEVLRHQYFRAYLMAAIGRNAQ
jgi:hypothetical protein